MASLSTKVKLYCEANSKTADFGPKEVMYLYRMTLTVKART